jgi:hypothetical protein
VDVNPGGPVDALYRPLHPTTLRELRRQLQREAWLAARDILAVRARRRELRRECRGLADRIRAARGERTMSLLARQIDLTVVLANRCTVQLAELQEVLAVVRAATKPVSRRDRPGRLNLPADVGSALDRAHRRIRLEAAVAHAQAARVWRGVTPTAEIEISHAGV